MDESAILRHFPPVFVSDSGGIFAGIGKIAFCFFNEKIGLNTIFTLSTTKKRNKNGQDSESPPFFVVIRQENSLRNFLLLFHFAI